MNKPLLFSVVLLLFILNQSEAQLPGILNRARSVVAIEISDNNSQDQNKTEPAPEPACACDPAELIIDLSDGIEIDYSEIGISYQDDGSLLVNNQMSGEYFIVKDGKKTGPFKAGDPQIQIFGSVQSEGDDIENLLLRNKDYISRSGDKLLITFLGEKYGPYARINDFIVTKSKDKFVAMVVEDILMTEDQGKRMEEAMENAQSDEERMALSMQFARQMSAGMMNSNGMPKDLSPKFITNIPGTTFDLMTTFGGKINGTLKYDDILVLAPDKISDLKGNTLFTIMEGGCNSQEMFVNSTNTKYACFSFGTLTFSDNTTMSELFNPRLVRVDGKVYLAYMYYSPGRNSIMECKMLF